MSAHSTRSQGVGKLFVSLRASDKGTAILAAALLPITSDFEKTEHVSADEARTTNSNRRKTAGSGHQAKFSSSISAKQRQKQNQQQRR